MTTKHTPATPLDTRPTGCSKGCTGRMCRDALHCDAKPQGTTPRDWQRKIEEREQTRRANAYPKLVEALRNLLAWADAAGIAELPRNNTSALLRSLGEDA